MTSADSTPHLERFESYDRARREFRWTISDRFNAATATLARQIEPVTRPALADLKQGGVNTYTFNGLDYLSDKFALVLAKQGIKKGDRVLVMLPQGAASLIAQLGILKLGAIIVLLQSSLNDRIARVIRDCSPRAVVINDEPHSALDSLNTPIETVFVADDYPAGEFAAPPAIDFWRAVYAASSDFPAAELNADSPAFIFYEDRNGKEVGVVYSHQSVVGALPAFEMSAGFGAREHSLVWTPDEWAGPSSLIGVVYPALWYGCQIVATDKRALTATDALTLLADCPVTHAYLTSSEMDDLLASRLAEAKKSLQLTTIQVDRLRDEIVASVRARFPGTIIEAAYRCTEAVGVISTCTAWFEPQGCGRAVPGHEVAIVDQQGNLCASDRRGNIAIKSGDPASALGYWQQDGRVASQDTSGWRITKDIGWQDDDGNIWIL
jgi:acetyl-CoA synthetase